MHFSKMDKLIEVTIYVRDESDEAALRIAPGGVWRTLRLQIDVESKDAKELCALLLATT